jgi:hypothetical protein
MTKYDCEQCDELNALCNECWLEEKHKHTKKREFINEDKEA